jgi:NTE family protein
MTKKKVHLVLGSGGARGIAHIGVIELLEEAGFEIISITGCSMGAVVGGIYCAGFLQPYKNWLLTLNKAKVYSLFDFTINKNGFIKGEKILSFLRTITGEQSIEQFKIPFTAVATDILHKKEVHYRSGNLYSALRASMGIPGVFTPVAENGTYMVDGGVLNPLPLNLVSAKEDELIVAVNLNGHTYSDIESPKKEESENISDSWAWFKSLSIPMMNKNTQSATALSFSLFELLQTSYNYTQDRLTEVMIQFYPPDVLIEIPRKSSTTYEFYRAAELIALGKKAYHEAMDKTTK